MNQTAIKMQLTPSQLTAQLSENIFSQPKENTDDEQTFVGHERAKEALEFGLSMNAVGFNVFAMGEPGTGRQTLIKQMLSASARVQNTPQEWCYINNFDDNHAPYRLYVSPGDGKQLLARINTFIDELIDLFPEVFENPSYQRQKSAIDREFNQQYDEAISKVEETALKNNVVLYEEDGEIGFSPLVDGKPLNDKEFANLDELKRADFYKLLAELEDFLSEQLLELPQWKRISSDKLRKLKNETAELSIKPFFKRIGT